jgi:AcrR family transcriptional regulator
MGRPQEHNEETASALLAAAERVVETEGLGALSLRRVAGEAETTTRAVYTLFGSRDGLVAGLGGRAFELLRAGIESLPATSDPAADLVEAGVAVFRTFAVEHPSLFALAVQRAQTAPAVAAEFDPVRLDALAGLRGRIERLEAKGLLGGRPVGDVLCAFHSLCEGLAAVELRGLLPNGEEERIWRDALTALLAGFTAAG